MFDCTGYRQQKLLAAKLLADVYYSYMLSYKKNTSPGFYLEVFSVFYVYRLQVEHANSHHDLYGGGRHLMAALDSLALTTRPCHIVCGTMFLHLKVGGGAPWVADVFDGSAHLQIGVVHHKPVQGWY